MTASQRVAPTAKKTKTSRTTTVAGGVALLLAVVAGCSSASASTVSVTANKDWTNTSFTPDAIKDLAFTVTGKDLAAVKLTYDGQPVTGVTEGTNLVYRPTNLAEGKHTFAANGETEAFEVDGTAPVLTIDKAADDLDKTKPFTLTGSAAGAKIVKVDDKEVALEGDRFKVDYPTAPLSAKVWAQDAAGNVAEQTVTVGQNYPAMRAVHMTGIAWLTPSLKDPVIQALKDKRIDAVQLDIKDEDGAVAFDAASEAANLSGADKKNGVYDPVAAAKEIHDLGGTVIGRVVAFKDPLLATWAAKNGRMDWVIQDKAGNPYRAGTYGAGAFTNFANAEVRKYNIELGVEAAKAGFDSIMYDYIRRPEANATSGNLAGQVFPGIGSTDPQDSIANFLAEAQPQIHAAGAQVGAAVFGISAFTPISVAQNIPKMAKHLDYINPMVYPSHWGPGEYSVAAPNSMPYEIVNRSMMDFNRQVLGTNCVIIPWLQAFPWAGVSYGEENIRKQIKAAADAGINSWILWNASAKYTWSALDPKEKSSDYPGETVYSINKPGNRSDGTKDAAKAEEFIKAYAAWVEGGRQGVFVAPGEAPAGGTTPATPGTTSAPSTPAATTSPSAAPSASATAAP